MLQLKWSLVLNILGLCTGSSKTATTGFSRISTRGPSSSLPTLQSPSASLPVVLKLRAGADENVTESPLFDDSARKKVSDMLAEKTSNLKKAVMAKLDYDGDGKISFEELKRGALSFFDKDGDGKLSIQDAVRMLDHDGDGKFSFQDIINMTVASLDTDGDGKVSFEELEAGGQMWLDHAEDLFHKARELSHKYSLLVSAVLGYLALFYGNNFIHTLIFWRSFEATGWPKLRKGFEELGDSWVKARAALKEQAPKILVAKKAKNKHMTQALRSKLEAYQQTKEAVKAGQLDEETVAASLKTAETEMADMQKVLAGMTKAMGSMQVIQQAVDPDKVKAILEGMWMGLAACSAAAASSKMANMGMGMNIAGRVANTTKRLVMPLLEKAEDVIEESDFAEEIGDKLSMTPVGVITRKWKEVGVDWVCTAITVWITFKLEKLVSTLNIALMGAFAVSTAILKVANRALSGDQKESFQQALTWAHTGLPWVLAAYGFFSQVKPGGGRLPWYFKIFLVFPLLLESYLKALSVRELARVAHSSGSAAAPASKISKSKL